MEQASVLDGFPFDALALEQDGLAPAGVDVCGGQVLQALVVAPVVVVVDERLDPQGEVTGQIG